MSNEEIISFLEYATMDNDLNNDFGYLLIPEDERLNSEAMSIIRRKFKEFCKINNSL